MRQCSVRPYEGKQDYIFVSYCHKDKRYVFPMIEQLAHDGYRVWYDEGINPGSEWPEVIAEHLSGSALCLAIVSENALSSHNCRREINYTLLKKKPMISVMIEKVALSPGMQMQLSLAQSILKTEMTEEAFFEKLYESPLTASSLGEPDESVSVSKPDDYEDDDDENKAFAGGSFSDKWFSEKKSDARYEQIRLTDDDPGSHPSLFDDDEKETPSDESAPRQSESSGEDEKNVKKENSGGNPVPQKQKRRRPKWLIPTVASVLALAIVAGIIAIASTVRKEANDEEKYNEIVEFSTTCEGYISSVDDIEVAYEGYRYFHEYEDDYYSLLTGIVLHGTYTTVKDEYDSLYADNSRLYKDNSPVCQLTDIRFSRYREWAVSIPLKRSELTPGNYTFTIDVNSGGTGSFSGNVTLSFTVEPIKLSDSVSFVANEIFLDGKDSNKFLKDHIGETVAFYNGKVAYEGAYYLDFDPMSEYDNLSLADSGDVQKYLGSYISGEAKVMEVTDDTSGSGKSAALELSKIYQNDRIYVPECSGLSPDDAESMLTEIGLEYKEILSKDETYDGYMDMVLKQDLIPGKMVDRGTKITLTVHRDYDSEPVSSMSAAFSSAVSTDTLKPYKGPDDKTITYDAENVLKEDNSCWSTDDKGPGESITVSFTDRYLLNGLRIINGYAGTEKQYTENTRPLKILCEFSDGKTEIHELKELPVAERMNKQTIVFDEGHLTSYVKITVLTIKENTKYEDTCITYIEPYYTSVSIQTDENIELQAQVIKDGTLLERLYAIAAYNKNMIEAYEFTFLDSGLEVVPEKDVTVRIPCENAAASVFFVDEPNNKATDMKAEFVDGYLEFKTRENGYYVIADVS